MKIALTGGIACGKSLLSKFLNELGVETIDADDVVHELIPDPAERRRIAAEVFADPEKRRAPNHHHSATQNLFSNCLCTRSDSLIPPPKG